MPLDKEVMPRFIKKKKKKKKGHPCESGRCKMRSKASATHWKEEH